VDADRVLGSSVRRAITANRKSVIVVGNPIMSEPLGLARQVEAPEFRLFDYDKIKTPVTLRLRGSFVALMADVGEPIQIICFSRS